MKGEFDGFAQNDLSNCMLVVTEDMSWLILLNSSIISVVLQMMFIKL